MGSRVRKAAGEIQVSFWLQMRLETVPNIANTGLGADTHGRPYLLENMIQISEPTLKHWLEARSGSLLM